MSNIDVIVVKDFPDNTILFFSGDINIDKLDKEEMKKIVWIKIENE
jgi:hypothetical protein